MKSVLQCPASRLERAGRDCHQETGSRMLTLRQAHEWLAEFVSDFDAGKRLPRAVLMACTSYRKEREAPAISRSRDPSGRPAVPQPIGRPQQETPAMPSDLRVFGVLRFRVGLYVPGAFAANTRIPAQAAGIESRGMLTPAPAAAPSPTSATAGSPENGGFVSGVFSFVCGRGV